MWPIASPLPRLAQHRLGEAIAQLASDPRPTSVVKLSGKAGLYRVRWGDYRVIYQIHDDRLLILVVKVGHRNAVYRGH